MATVGAKAKRRAEARDRLDQEVARLVDRLGIEVPADGPTIRDPELVQIIAFERQGVILASINAALDAMGVERAAPEPESVGEDTGPDLSTMKRPELLSIAESLDIENPRGIRKNVDLVAAIEAAQAAATSQDPDAEASGSDEAEGAGTPDQPTDPGGTE